ncbi:ubiquinol--cytochrome-c reductase subunit 2 [Sugiyamaella lignohabitans]|uniref:Cytochrome b-c1 complex subunit 2, mitochondrial n=1 Tax=Sugiyamaella lignohabitans TaxID=796027 RepID=A0A167FCB3_9ASCO|nr:ubiquinol--cytochrome-c reductase subunit 2 [Sugiyamaella lignohabitans]ANB15109.1 ubiquinol--cytochrome-c reductase subunit 2 [Sugiyamaella lignohabitans]
MLSKSSILRTSGGLSTKRTMARFLSTTEASGLKVSSIEDSRPVSEISLVVRAGSRYEPKHADGVAHYLEKFAYKNTQARSGLRLTRESELLGGQLSSSLTRENLILTAKFLREDLPYFVNALGDVVENTIYNKYELDEEVAPLAKLEYELAHSTSSAYVALEAAHQVAFHTGLGNSILSHPLNPVSIDAIKNYAREAYAKANIQIVARGIDESDLSALIGSSKLSSLSAGSPLETPSTSVHSGEARIRAAPGNVNAVVIAFPTTGSSAANSILAQHLGTAVHSVKWSLGGSTPLGVAGRKTGTTIYATNAAYSDASLLYLTVEGPTAAAAKAGAIEAVNALKAVAATELTSEQLTRATAKAKFANAEALESSLSTVITPAVDTSITAATLKETAAALTSGKVALAVVGQVTELPYLDELF